MEIERTSQILLGGDFSQFNGAEEDAYLEVKSVPYDLTIAAGRYELAKDVVSLANSKGGYLLIGLTTARRADKPVDAISALSLVAPSAFTPAQYEGIIGTHIYPAITGLVVGFHVGAETTDGIGAVLVPPQDDDRKPFIIAKVADDAEYLKQIVVGYAERLGASNEPFSPERLQQALKKGQDSHSQRLTRLEEKIDELLARDRLVEARPQAVPQSAPEAGPFDIKTLEQRIDTALAEVQE